MLKRTTIIGILMALMFTALIFRMFNLSTGEFLIEAANRQSNFVLDVGTTRSKIYDSNFLPFTGNTTKIVGAVLPSPESKMVLNDLVVGKSKQQLDKMMDARVPFVMDLPHDKVYSNSVEVIDKTVRYPDEAEQLAVHLLGYTDKAEENGIAGIEKNYDAFLKEGAGKLKIRYKTDGMGRPLKGEYPTLVSEDYNTNAGIVLTLDQRMQKIAQEALSEEGHKGAVIITDVYTGEIKAMASNPTFDQNKIEEHLNCEDACLTNRALSQYSLGSIFKLLVSAAALDSNLVGKYYSYDCKGYYNVKGTTFNCFNHKTHGVIDMKKALEVSCNTYFVNLINVIGKEKVIKLAKSLEFGSSFEIADGIVSAKGNLPTYDQLKNIAEVGNFSFGQGVLLTTPIQVTRLINAIANGGIDVIPKLVAGTTQDGASLLDKTPTYTKNRVISKETSDFLIEAMVSVVERGSGQRAKPKFAGAGGKTGSAQTGVYEKNGVENVNAWFTGFFPANKPKYSVVVMVQDGGEGSIVAAPIFKKVVDQISAFSLPPGYSEPQK